MKNFESLMALPTPCQQLPDHEIFGMPVWIKRDDLVHPVISGNKYRKLKYPLRTVAQQFSDTGVRPTLVTMGGLWSTHVHATAYAAAELGYRSHAMIRGHDGVDSAMLADCRARGMTIQFVDRVAYRVLRAQGTAWQSQLEQIDVMDGCKVWLPEGGSAPHALHGVAELIAELPFFPDVILVSCGTGATLAGLLAGLRGQGRVIGIAVFDNADYLRAEISRLLVEAGYSDYQNFELVTDMHHGGYAKTTPALQHFCRDFVGRYGVPVEPVYTGKMFFALKTLIETGRVDRHAKVICLHTGGLQGARGGSWL